MDRPFWMSTANRGASLVSRPTTLAQAPQASPRSAAPASVPHSVNCIHQQRTCQDQGAHLPSIAVGKLGACISLMSIGPDTCLRLQIKEAFDWKQGAPSGTVLLPLQMYEDEDQLHLERFGFQIGCIVWCPHSIIQCSRRKCYGAAAVGCWSKRSMGGVCKWGRHIWTSTSTLYSANDGLTPWYKARVMCPTQGCARPGIHS